MWARPWKYKEGAVIGAGLFLTGALLQLTIGKINWSLLAAPVNYIILGLYVGLMAVAHLCRHKSYILSWLSSSSCAVTSIAWASVMTVVMGLVKQSPATSSGSFPGFSQMLSQWSFVLIYFWMMTSLFLSVLRVCIPFKAKKIPFLMNHLGLFVALLCGTMGAADLQRLTMNAVKGVPQWRASDESGNIYELPIAIELQDFTIDEYPPKVVLADNQSGAIVSPQGYNIQVDQLLTDAAPVFMEDTVKYSEYYSEGACAAALVTVTKDSGQSVSGWVSCGSFAFPFKSLTIDEQVSVVMPEREPQRYVSAVNVYTQSGKSFSDTIKVNSPLRVEGWKVYQLDYDHNMGKWSTYSVFEIVRDPWLAAVYVGFVMMIAGAVCMFVHSGAKKEDRV